MRLTEVFPPLNLLYISHFQEVHALDTYPLRISLRSPTICQKMEVQKAFEVLGSVCPY